jgi:tripartite-type tricarboxylate transporter receptor subunit TctC
MKQSQSAFKRRIVFYAAMCIALTTSLASLEAMAQVTAFPTKPLRLIVPFPAGSASDGAARILARAMGEQLKQPITVENKPGANGILGVEQVKQSVGDPYVLLVTASTTHAANLSLYKQLPYDPIKDFTPLAKMGVTAFVLMVRPEFPANNLNEFLVHARANTGKLSYGHGTAGMLASGALLTKMGGFTAQPIPYKGVPPAMIDLMGGTIDFSFVDVGNAVQQMKGGKLKAMGLTMSRRTLLAPDVPTFAESGMPGFEVVPWVGLLAPAKIPPHARDILTAAALAALNRADVRLQLTMVGLDPEPQNGDGLARTIDADIKLWARMLSDAGVKPE